MYFKNNNRFRDARSFDRSKSYREEYLIALDFLPNGYPLDSLPAHKRVPIIQAIGKKKFVLLELVPKRDVTIQPNAELYAGQGRRDEIHHILGRLSMDKLTQTAKMELPLVIERIISSREKEFVDFFNKAMPLSTRMHSLELLPGLGKKHMTQILEERDKSLFVSFDDIKNRVKLVPDPKKVIVRRILLELEGNEKHNLFVEK